MLPFRFSYCRWLPFQISAYVAAILIAALESELDMSATIMLGSRPIQSYPGFMHILLDLARSSSIELDLVAAAINPEEIALR
jgi:hypothetical protein